MNGKNDLKRNKILHTVGLGVASAGFVLTWALPGLGAAGPIASLPFALLALWLQQRRSQLAHEPAPSERRATSFRNPTQQH